MYELYVCKCVHNFENGQAVAKHGMTWSIGPIWIHPMIIYSSKPHTLTKTPRIGMSPNFTHPSYIGPLIDPVNLEYI